MKILVCIKQVPGTNKVEVDPKTGVLLRDGTMSKMNPYDLYALETGLRLKQQYGGSVDVISMGPMQASAVIREAYSMGADDGALVSDRRFGGADVLMTAYTLSQGIRRMGSYDVILCGKQTTDGDTAQVGPETAEFLGLPSVSNVRAVCCAKAGTLEVEMELENHIQTMRVPMPCLLAVEKDIYQPRLPSYRRKLEREGADIEVYTLADMEDVDEDNYGLTGSPTQVVRIFPPDVRQDNELWQGPAHSLAGTLHQKLQQLKFV